MKLTYGVVQTKYGYEPCILQEDGQPLMTSGHPFKSWRDALHEALRLTAREDAKPAAAKNTETFRHREPLTELSGASPV